LGIAGLGFSLAGALVLARGLFKSPGTIRSIATQAAVLGGRTDESAVREFERDRLYGTAGAVLLFFGFLLELISRVV